MELFDAHNHLQDPALAETWRAIAEQMQAVGIRGAAVNGTGEDDWAAVMDLATRHPGIRPQVGLHPWHVGNRSSQWKESLNEFLGRGAGVGEIGLDRWMLERALPDDSRLAGLRRAPMEEQVTIFREQLALAAVLDRPASIHCLEAWNDLIPILKHDRLPPRGFLLHAFGGPEEQIAWLAARGAYFSFNGNFLSAPQSRRCLAFRRVPKERLLIETDAPAMPMPPEYQRYPLPTPAGAKALNHPANLIATYEALALILEVQAPELAFQTAENFTRLFGTP